MTLWNVNHWLTSFTFLFLKKIPYFLLWQTFQRLLQTFMEDSHKLILLSKFQLPPLRKADCLPPHMCRRLSHGLHNSSISNNCQLLRKQKGTLRVVFSLLHISNCSLNSPVVPFPHFILKFMASSSVITRALRALFLKWHCRWFYTHIKVEFVWWELQLVIHNSINLGAFEYISV